MNETFKKIMRGTAELGQAGFTLMEMLIVIALIGLMGSFVAVKVMDRFDHAKVDSTKIQMKQLGVILEDFRRVCGFYPTTDQNLDALVKKPEGGRACPNYEPEGFVKKVPKDAWDRDFIYESNGNAYKLKSLGRDGAEGGEGYDKDINSDELD